MKLRPPRGLARVLPAALLMLVVTCGGSPAATAPGASSPTAPNAAAVTASAPVRPTDVPRPSGTPTATTSPAASPSVAASAVTIRFEPAVPVSGAVFLIVVGGLTPGESVTVAALPIGFGSSGGTPPVTADANGEAVARTIFNIGVVAPGASSLDMVARVQRADGSTAEQRFALSAVGAAAPADSGAPIQSSGCTPSSGPSGTDFRCLFEGFVPGAVVHECFTRAGSADPIVACLDFAVPAIGLFVMHTDVPLAPGPYVYTVTSGHVSRTAEFTVTR